MALELEDLPVDILAGVGKTLNGRDLVELAYCSNQWSTLIKSWRIRIVSIYVDLRCLVVSSEPRRANVTLGINLFDKGHMHFLICEKTQEELDAIALEPGRVVMRTMGGVTFKCKIEATIYNVYTTEPTVVFFALLAHGTDLFQGAVDNLTVSYVDEQLDDMVIRILNDERFGKCPTLTIGNDGIISRRLMEKVLSMDHLMKLNQIGNPGSRFVHSQVVRIPELRMSLAYWVPMSMLLSMTCEKIQLADTKFSLEEHNAFLRAWQSGSVLRNLSLLSIGFCKRWAWHEKGSEAGEVVFAGVDVEECDEKTCSLHPMVYINPTIEYGLCKGVHIKRCDGTLAFVVLQEWYFCLIVAQSNSPLPSSSSSSSSS